MELLISNARLRNCTDIMDIAVDNGRIKQIKKTGELNKSNFDDVIDAKESLVTESFSSPHIHLDKVLIGESIVNESGELWEAIKRTWNFKSNYTCSDIVKRASRVIDKQIGYGVTKFRTHVDIDSICGLKALEGLLKTKEKYRDTIELQIVAFPQEGIIKNSGTKERLIKAMEMGADVMGGMPHNENTEQDSIEHVKVIYDIAEDFGVPIDSHTDETDDPYSRTLEYMAAEKLRRNFPHAVTVDHICALMAYEPYHAERVINLVAKADIKVVTNPPTNMVLQGRKDQVAQRVGMTRVKELIDAGVTVTVGQDCIRDPYYPFGRGDMLEIANLAGHGAKMTLPDEIEHLYDMITYNARKIMELKDEFYSLQEGAFADLVILKGVSNVWEAIRILPPGRIVLRKGKVIAESSYSETRNY